jgi:regulatory protein
MELMSDTLYQKYLTKALGLISRRKKSKKEIELYLLKYVKKDPLLVESIERIIARLEELGYINDTAYAESFIRDKMHLQSKGIVYIKYQLHARGISRDSIEAAYRKVVAESPVEDDVIRKLVQKKMSLLRGAKPDFKKLIVYLMRRGFSYELASRVVDEEVKNEYNEDV